jgi:4-hydroxy-3-methylbut-2-en-1-yl diphosphate reductase
MAKIRKAENLGFCMGVRRAVAAIGEAAGGEGGVETLGALVHNQQVLDKLARRGVRTVNGLGQVKGRTVAISAHGVGPRVTDEIARRGLKAIDTTCPFVRRTQMAAKRLVEDGFFVVVFGDVNHPEVRGILGWADDRGLATREASDLLKLPELPRRLGVLSQTTQVPADFIRFVKDVIDLALVRDAEIRLIDTVCHDTRARQEGTLKLAQESDLVLVVGGRSSANTRHLCELCAGVTETRLIETAAEIEPSWLKGKERLGVAAGASTDDETIDEVVKRLEELTQGQEAGLV